MRTARVLVIAIAAMVIAACGGGDDAPTTAPASGSVNVEAGDLYFEPTSLTAAAGDVQVTVENTGAVEHDFVIEEIGDVEVVYADPGATVTGTVNLEAGTYTFYCSVPGHRAAGMEGTLTVQ